MRWRGRGAGESGRRRWLRRATPTLVLVPVLVVLVAKTWVVALAFGETHDAVADAPERDVVIVFGAGLREGGPSPYLRARLDLARDLLAEDRARVVLVSGDNRTEQYDEPTAMKEYLVAAGVPAERVVLDHAGRDTYDTCVRAHKIFGVDEAVLVTQGYHLGRAVATCRAVGVDAVGVGDDSMRQYQISWYSGVAREYPANVKAAWDVLSRRDPLLGEQETGVRDALDESD